MSYLRSLAVQEEDRFKWDPSNARWVRVKPGRDEQGKQQWLASCHSLLSSYADDAESRSLLTSLRTFPSGKYTTDNWEKGGGATITPLSGSPYVVGLCDAMMPCHQCHFQGLLPPMRLPG